MTKSYVYLTVFDSFVSKGTTCLDKNVLIGVTISRNPRPQHTQFLFVPFPTVLYISGKRRDLLIFLLHPSSTTHQSGPCRLFKNLNKLF
jgi:hypothetical protein